MSGCWMRWNEFVVRGSWSVDYELKKLMNKKAIIDYKIKVDYKIKLELEKQIDP